MNLITQNDYEIFFKELKIRCTINIYPNGGILIIKISDKKPDFYIKMLDLYFKEYTTLGILVKVFPDLKWYENRFKKIKFIEHLPI